MAVLDDSIKNSLLNKFTEASLFACADIFTVCCGHRDRKYNWPVESEESRLLCCFKHAQNVSSSLKERSSYHLLHILQVPRFRLHAGSVCVFHGISEHVERF